MASSSSSETPAAPGAQALSTSCVVPTLRAASRTDIQDVLRLYAQASLDVAQELTLERAEALFAKMASYPDYRVYVAEVGGAIVGTFALLVMDNLTHLGAPSGVVEAVAVAPALQGRGVGRAMMAHAIEHCRGRGCYKLTLSSNLKRNNAHAFYERLGFERHGYSFRIDLTLGTR
jgi:GNAT superfamily N-acetyltransferase